MKISNKWVIPLAVVILTFSIAGGAFAVSGGSSSTDTTASGTVTTAADTSSTGATQGTTNTTAAAPTEKGWGKQGNGETALTGDTLTQVQAAALAAAGSGSTLVSATNETDNSDSTIKYEAFVKKSDGTSVKMYLDASFKVVSTENGVKGYGCKGGRGGNGGNGETALTGDTLTQVQTAALAAAGSGSTLIRASNETDNSDSTIKYEAFVKKSDGTSVKMYLDASFKVVSTENAPQGGMHRGGADNDGAPSGAASTSSSISSN